GAVTATLTRVPNAAGESPLGDIIADAQLAATAAEKDGGAVIAITNPGGIRSDVAMTADGTVSYGDVFAAQPFRNQLVTTTLSGAQIKLALEQQWLDPKRPRMLPVSKGFSYVWDDTRPFGSRVAAERILLNGQRVEPDKTYRVTINAYLAAGGDGFTALKDGAAQQVGVYDVDALYAYFKANSPVSPGPADRIARATEAR
ncbi:MAG TPA: 5'-nucleotidase, partial [Tardiphaga sp.]